MRRILKPPNSQYREEDEVIDDMNEGRISVEKGRKRLHALRLDYQAAAEEAAQAAYDNEMESWA